MAEPIYLEIVANAVGGGWRIEASAGRITDLDEVREAIEEIEQIILLLFKLENEFGFKFVLGHEENLYFRRDPSWQPTQPASEVL